MSESFLRESIDVLARTPAVLDALLRGLPDEWINATDGPGTWSAYDVVGHLNHGDRTDWIARLIIILDHGPERPFDAVDREAQFRHDEGRRKPIGEMLDEFRALRNANLETLRNRVRSTGEQLELEGTHPAFGPVTLRQLIATWTAHDLAHILQISRTMARRYRSEVGPWAEYLSVMR